MKSLIKAVALAAVLAAPLATFAQANESVTRAQVRAQLVQLEKAGYNPARGGKDPYYPDDIRAAEARVAAENGSTSGVGGVVSGSSESGAAAVSATTGTGSLYTGH